MFANRNTIMNIYNHITKNKKAGMSFFGDRAHYTDLGRKVIVDEILKSLGESIARKAQEIQNL